MDLDLSLFQLLHGLTGHSSLIDAAIVFFATYVPYALVLGWLALVFRESNRKRRWHFLISGALTLLLSRGLVTEGIRYFFDRPRPFDVLGFMPLITQDAGGAFPSGHAAFFFALAMAVWAMDRRAGLAYAVLALANGLARVASGIHWPTDILGGALVGILSFTVVRALVKPYGLGIAPNERHGAVPEQNAGAIEKK